MKRHVFTQIKCLIYGILATLAFSFQYSFQGLEDRDISAHKVVNAMLLFSKWFNGYGLVWTVLGIGFAYIFWITEKECRNKNQHLIPGLVGVSVIFGTLNVIGLCMHFMNSMPFFDGFSMAFASFLTIIGWSLMFYTFALWFLWYMTKAENNAHGWITDRRLFWYSVGFILLCWLPWMVSFYPASMDNDVFYQLDTVLGYMPKHNHHPWFSSRVLTACYQVGSSLGSENAGIFLYIVLRNVIMAMIYSRGVILLKRTSINKKFVALAVLFYAVTPVWGGYAKHAFKDTFAAGLFCWFIVALVTAIKKERERKDTLLNWAEVGVSGTISSFFRNNVIYAVLPTVLILLLYLLLKKKQIIKSAVLVGGLLLFFLYNQYIFTVGGVQRGETEEALSIPFQQTARVVALHHDELSETERKAISKFWDYDALPGWYNPILSDPVKFNYTPVDGKNEKDYLLLWAMMFPDYPREYFEAAFAQSYGYYAFTPKRAYWEGNYNSNMVLFHWIGTTAFPSDAFHFSYIKKMDLPRQILAKWADIWDKTPVLNITDTIAAYTWMIVLIGFYLFTKRRFIDLLPVFACLLLILTCVASPVNDCFRYYAPVAVSLPVLFAGALYR